MSTPHHQPAVQDHLLASSAMTTDNISDRLAYISLKSNMTSSSACDALSDTESVMGTSPVSPLPGPSKVGIHHAVDASTDGPLCHSSLHATTKDTRQKDREDPMSYTNLSYKTLVGVSEILGHTLDDRSSIASQQDPDIQRRLQENSEAKLRSSSQRPLFTVAPLDVLVTRDPTTGKNTFHIIEINGTGIAGISNMPDTVVGTIMRSMSELPQQLSKVAAPLVLVASSGQESKPPVSRTMHEKVLYIEALKRGFEAVGRPVTVMNMMKLETEPHKLLSSSGPVVVLGYMKQFRHHMSLGPNGELLLLGRQVHAAINDRFVLNIMHQFGHKVDLSQFMGYNVGFTAGADKGVAYTLYNQFFGACSQPNSSQQYTSMARSINFSYARTRCQLVSQVQSWLASQNRPVVIKPQGTGCGHGIEFFFGKDAQQDVESKVDASISTVSKTYALECGGLPFTVCEYLDTASISDAAAKQHVGNSIEGCDQMSDAGSDVSSLEPHPMAGHKFELRIVVYRDGDVLKAYPAIAKVAREAFDPENPDKASLINNITTSAKATNQAGSEFMLPLCCHRTLGLLGIQESELADLCAASTGFIRYVVDQVQDCPELFGLPVAQKQHEK